MTFLIQIHVNTKTKQNKNFFNEVEKSFRRKTKNSEMMLLLLLLMLLSVFLLRLNAETCLDDKCEKIIEEEK